tara:strand:- start:3614 stop:4276 length:663 start_codon:yes stop_codon:yes gene_type:complete
LKKIDIFYAALNAKKFERLNDFYYYCIDYANNGLALDIGSDNFLGLTKKLLDKQWVGDICAFDLQDLKEYDNKIEFYSGDVLDTITSVLEDKNKKISILEIDLREPTISLNEDLDLKRNRVNEVLTLCDDYLNDNVVIIINEFMNDVWGSINPDGYFLADFFEKNNKSYECLGYLPYYLSYNGELLGNEGATAWVVSDSKSLQGNDLKNLINQLWTHSPF